MWHLFVSICSASALCTWLEVTEPYFKNEQQCEAKGVEFGKRIRETEASAYGAHLCVPTEDLKEFKEWLQSQSGYSK